MLWTIVVKCRKHGGDDMFCVFHSEQGATFVRLWNVCSIPLGICNIIRTFNISKQLHLIPCCLQEKFNRFTPFKMFPVSKVLDRRSDVNGHVQYLVWWKNYSSKYDSWIDEKNVNELVKLAYFRQNTGKASVLHSLALSCNYNLMCGGR